MFTNFIFYPMIFHIKFMVSLRCKLMVKSELAKLGLHWVSVELGVVEIQEKISPEQLALLKIALKRSGLELLDDHRNKLINRIKTVIVEMVHYSDEVLNVNYSDFISEKLDLDYTYLSNIFSETTGTTIQHYIIIHKIERAKELLLYDELTLYQIADKLNYSSIAHLSRQFKKITGLTPRFFKTLKIKRLKNLEDL